VSLVWYPSNWWETITLTQWKISWFDAWFYKVDASIDSWNSGWWAFDDDGSLVWIPSFAIDGLTALGYIIPVDTIRDFLAWSTVQDLISIPSDADFIQYRRELLEVFSTWVINDATLMTSSIKEYGFDFFIWANSWTYDVFNYQFLDKSRDTLVDIDKYLQTTNEYWMTGQDIILKWLAEIYDTVYSKEISLWWNNRLAVYTQWRDWSPNAKSLNFILISDENWVIHYNISSTSQDTASFVQAIKYFLEGFKVSGSFSEAEINVIGNVVFPKVDWIDYVLNISPDGLANIEIIFDKKNKESGKNFMFAHKLPEWYFAVDRWDEELESSGLFFEDSFDEDQITIIDDRYKTIVVKAEDNESTAYIVSLFDESSWYLFTIFLNSESEDSSVEGINALLGGITLWWESIIFE